MRIQFVRVENLGLVAIRWAVSGFFFFLGITKLVSMIRFGIEPYEQFVIMSGLPEILKYYGAVACILEFYLAVGVWIKRIYLSALATVIVLSTGGVALSLYSLVLKQTEECHCGLLGNNEYGLLGQKILIIGTLVFMAKRKERLSF